MCALWICQALQPHACIAHPLTRVQYVLPTDSPHLATHALRLAISPMLWAQCKPDRFDSWSAGLCYIWPMCVCYGSCAHA